MKERTRQWMMEEWSKWLKTMPLRHNDGAWALWLKGLLNSLAWKLATRMEPKAGVPKPESHAAAMKLTRQFLTERLGEGALKALDSPKLS
jgi:hypothetical protein